MASNESIQQLQDLSEAIANVDEGKLLRASLGKEALQKQFAPILEKIRKRSYSLAIRVYSSEKTIMCIGLR